MAIAALSTENLVTASEHLALYRLPAPEEVVVGLDDYEFAEWSRNAIVFRAADATQPFVTRHCRGDVTKLENYKLISITDVVEDDSWVVHPIERHAPASREKLPTFA